MCKCSELLSERTAVNKNEVCVKRRGENSFFNSSMFKKVFKCSKYSIVLLRYKLDSLQQSNYSIVFNRWNGECFLSMD